MDGDEVGGSIWQQIYAHHCVCQWVARNPSALQVLSGALMTASLKRCSHQADDRTAMVRQGQQPESAAGVHRRAV